MGVPATTTEATISAIQESLLQLSATLGRMAAKQDQMLVDWKKRTAALVPTTTTTPMFVSSRVGEQTTKPSSSSLSSAIQVVGAGAPHADAVFAAAMPTRCSTVGSAANIGNDHVVVVSPSWGNTQAEVRVPYEPSLDRSPQPSVALKLSMSTPPVRLTKCSLENTEVQNSAVVETDKPTPWEPGLGGVGLDKEGDEERPMPWPSFVCYWLITSSMKLRRTPQGITLKLLVEDMQTVLGCPLSRYPLPICSKGSRSCFQCSLNGCRKMVVRCLSLVPSINPVVCPPWRQPDRATHKAMLPYIQSDAMLLHAYDHFSLLHKNLLMRRMILIVFLVEAFSDMAQLPLKITWPPQGLCAGLSLWEASFSGPQRGQMCFWQFGSVRKNCVAGFSAQPTSASNWKLTFQLCWKHQACYCIQSIAKKHYRILPCMGKNCQYVTYPAASATTTVALVTLLKRISCVLWFSMIWDPGITECVMEVPYYPGHTIGVRPSVCRATAVHQYMNSDHLNPVVYYVHKQSMFKLSIHKLCHCHTSKFEGRPWDPGGVHGSDV